MSALFCFFYIKYLKIRFSLIKCEKTTTHQTKGIDVFKKYFWIFSTVFYFAVTTLMILLAFTLFVDIFWGIGLLIFNFKMSSLPSFDTLIIISTICAVWALIEGTRIPSTKMTLIETDKITQPSTVVFLSDLHIDRDVDRAKINGIVQRVNALKPDIVILGGDTIDDKLPLIDNTLQILSQINARMGRFFVAGNHEFYRGKAQCVQQLKKLGFTFLENNGVALNDIFVAGIPDITTSAGSVDVKKAFHKSQNNEFRILVSHTPHNFKEQNCFDLELAGHTHGGQIFPFHILSKMYNRYLFGLYTLSEKTYLYVSRGSGQWGPQMRFLANAEISVIHLKPKKKQTKYFDETQIKA